MRLKGPQEYFASHNYVIKVVKFNSLQLLAFYSRSKTREVRFYYARIMELLCAFEVVQRELHVHVDMGFSPGSTDLATTGTCFVNAWTLIAPVDHFGHQTDSPPPQRWFPASMKLREAAQKHPTKIWDNAVIQPGTCGLFMSIYRWGKCSISSTADESPYVSSLRQRNLTFPHPSNTLHT